MNGCDEYLPLDDEGLCLHCDEGRAAHGELAQMSRGELAQRIHALQQVIAMLGTKLGAVLDHAGAITDREKAYTGPELCALADAFIAGAKEGHVAEIERLNRLLAAKDEELVKANLKVEALRDRATTAEETLDALIAGAKKGYVDEDDDDR